MSPDNSTSQFLTKETETIDQHFSDFEIFPNQGPNQLIRAKRYGRWWMLKGLKEECRNKEPFVSMLRKEFEIMVGMQSPYIVSTVGFEEVEGYGRCIVMEWIDGITLNEWLKQGHTGKEKLSIARQIIEALTYIHHRQTAHRDLKPSNIMVTHIGQHVKLIDFGLSDEDSYTFMKLPAGTEGYMAPEVRKASSVIDYQLADIYSFGKILSNMDMGRMFSHITRRCLSTVKKRYQHIEDVGKAMHKLASSPMRIIYSLLIVAGIGILSAAAVIWNNYNVREATSRLATSRHTATMKKATDSLYSAINTLKEQNQQISQSRDSLSNRLAEIEKQNTQQEKEEQEIQTAIREGQKIIDRMAQPINKKMASTNMSDNTSRRQFTENANTTALVIYKKLNSYVSDLPLDYKKKKQINDNLLNYIYYKYTSVWPSR